MTLAAVVVWFNPEDLGKDKAIQNINSYSDICSQIIVVDNSSEDNSLLAKKNEKIIYISNKNEGGIAGALNKGISFAKEKNCDYVITMDQDSCFETGKAKEYFDTVLKNIDKANSFVPVLKYKDSNVKPILKWPKDYFPKKLKSFIKYNLLRRKKSIAKQRTEFEFIDKNFTSGNIVKVELWEKVKKFDEYLFIDEVDFDFCNKILLANEKIVRLNNCEMQHNLGNSFKTLFPKVYYTKSKFRFYYIIRNKFIQKNRYSNLLKNHNYDREIWEFFRDYCIFNIKCFSFLKIYLKAKKDALDYIHQNG